MSAALRLSPAGRRRKMSNGPPAQEGRAATAAKGAAAGDPEKREPARPRMNGENILACQSKICSYMSPNKLSTARPPLQEENSTAHPEGKSQPCTRENCKKKEDRSQAGDSTHEDAKSEGPTGKAGESKLLPSTSAQRPELPEKGKLLPAESLETASPNLVQKKGNKQGWKKGQGKVQPNRKVTDYYPVRRSSRKNKKELQTEEKKRIDELIESGKEEGMKIDFIDGKGRGIIATRQFSRGEFVVEYHGDLLEIMDAKRREAAYAQDPSTGCYMYYFQYLSKTFCVDATKETNRFGRLINHSKCGNCQTKLHDIDGVPHLILVASRDIKAGEELLYDYGDRSKAALEAHPWLKH